MDTLIYASIPILIGFGLFCLVAGMVISSLFWSRYYHQQSNTRLTNQLASLTIQRQAIIGEVVRDLKHQLGNYLNIIKHRLAVMRGEMEQLPRSSETAGPDAWSNRWITLATMSGA